MINICLEIVHHDVMIQPGVYPAAVTPFDEKGQIDFGAVARLLAYFEANGCTGAVLAGTNGEGPSLSAPEKRDLIQAATSLKGKLDLILGIATCSITEAIWSSKQAEQAGAKAVLVMPPFYFRETLENICSWFEALMEKSPLPVVVYNFPQRTGITLTADAMERLGNHPMCGGLKDSSGDVTNLTPYRGSMKRPEQVLFVGDEQLLIKALESGWSGTISGVSNSLPDWVSQIVRHWHDGQLENARAKHELILPLIEMLRKKPQPSTHKGILHRMGVQPSLRVRLPLSEIGPVVVDEALALIEKTIGSRSR